MCHPPENFMFVSKPGQFFCPGVFFTFTQISLAYTPPLPRPYPQKSVHILATASVLSLNRLYIFSMHSPFFTLLATIPSQYPIPLKPPFPAENVRALPKLCHKNV